MVPRHARNRAEVFAAQDGPRVSTTCPSCKDRPKAHGEDYCAACIAATAPRLRCPECGGTVELTEAERNGRTFPVGSCSACEFITEIVSDVPRHRPRGARIGRRAAEAGFDTWEEYDGDK